MAYNVIPANANNTHGPMYSDAQFTEHDFTQAMVGLPHIAASGSTTGNGNYPLWTAASAAVLYGAVGTIVVAGTGATSNVTFSLVRANNGANVSNTITFVGNLWTTGTNSAGNVYAWEAGYNANSAGAQTGSNVVATGGITCNAGDTLYAAHTGNTLCVSVVVESQMLFSNTIQHL